ncbi:capsule biosynthesis protein [Kushneria aurantia]|uniref:Capsule biosynthesis protein n=1 Tax=Kushneria aurantia TaxID=504092 RepID=A0ABV6G566_9GAMM|nr:capsular biosynthesis protein [Kushneria aurantia]
MTPKRAFLFLQGVCTPFFNELARALKARGHRVVKINFTAGDRLYWREGNAHAWRGGTDGLVAFALDLYRRYEITDQVLFGDCRPMHAPLVEQARRHGIHNHVFEEGYLRPYWVTLEREGVNAHSMLPADPAWYREAVKLLPETPKPQRFKNPFRDRVFHDVAYHLAGAANPLLHPGYHNHAPFAAPREYYGYLSRFARLRGYKRRDQQRIEKLLTNRAPFFIMPLQLNGDAQVRHHSGFDHMYAFMDHVAATMAQHATSQTRLVIKNHPLDMGLTPHASDVERIAHHYGLDDRLIYLETGNLEKLVRHARGMITLNSTAGHVALERGCPVVALAQALYAMPGLTHQGDLASFWRDPVPPDRDLLDAFRRTVIHGVQLNGGFYSRQGIELAVHNAVPSLEAERSNLEQLLCLTHDNLHAVC